VTPPAPRPKVRPGFGTPRCFNLKNKFPVAEVMLPPPLLLVPPPSAILYQSMEQDCARLNEGISRPKSKSYFFAAASFLSGQRLHQLF
jgi:hypothetical protein